MKHFPIWLRIYVVLMMLVLVAPVAIVVLASVTPGDYVTFPPAGLSTRWYEKVIADPTFMVPLWNSIRLAAVSTLISLALAIPAAVALVRSQSRFNAIAEAFILSPLGLPTIILATGLLFFSARIGLSESWIGLVAGHSIVTLPYCFRTVYAVYGRANREMEDAARILGASRLRMFLHVTLPAIRPGIAAGSIFAALISFDEVAIALLMSTPSTQTLPVSIMTYLVYNYDPSVAAISTLQIAIVILMLLAIEGIFGLNRIMFPSAQQ